MVPDVVVSDVMMPRLSGLHLCRAVRADPGLAGIPIILLTARCLDAEIRSVIELGGITFMNKPYDAELLRDALRAALGDRDVTGPSDPGERFR